VLARAHGTHDAATALAASPFAAHGSVELASVGHESLLLWHAQERGGRGGRGSVEVTWELGCVAVDATRSLPGLPLLSVCFIAHRTVAAGAADGSLHIFAGREPRARLAAHAGAVLDIRLARDRWGAGGFVTASADGSAKLWPWDPAAGPHVVLLHVRLRPPPEHDGAAAAPADPEAGRTEEVAAWRREWALPQRREEALGFLALRGDETLARARELIEQGAEARLPPPKNQSCQWLAMSA